MGRRQVKASKELLLLTNQPKPLPSVCITPHVNVHGAWPTAKPHSRREPRWDCTALCPTMPCTAPAGRSLPMQMLP